MDLSQELTARDYDEQVELLKKNTESDVISLGRLLYEIKEKKIYRAFGYINFSLYVEDKLNLSASIANRYIRIFKEFVLELNIGEDTLNELGMSSLELLLKMFKIVENDKVELIQLAQKESYSNMKVKYQDLKEQLKEKEKTMEEVLTEQFYERATEIFNCSKKKVDFNLALFFSDKNMEEVKDIVDLKRKIFEEKEEGI